MKEEEGRRHTSEGEVTAKVLEVEVNTVEVVGNNPVGNCGSVCGTSAGGVGRISCTSYYHVSKEKRFKRGWRMEDGG